MKFVTKDILILTYHLLSTKAHALCNNDNIDTIIVGGGISGLAAAKSLTNAGECVKVLEANDYIGGRIKAINVGGIKSELGATWIHGIKKNPIKKLANKYNAKCVNEKDTETWKEYGAAYDQTAKQRFNYKFIDNYTNQFVSKVWKIRKKLKENANTEDAAEYFYKTNNIRGSTFDYRIAHYAIEDKYVGMDYGVESHKYSLQYLDKEGWFKGPDCVFSKGYEQIIEGLSENLSILYSTPVKLVEYFNNNVIVTTNENQQFKSKKVVITVSINVLKSDMIQFKPPLPNYKIKALNRLDMNHLEKMIITFPYNFWNTLEISFIASDTTESTDYFDLSNIYGTPTLMMFFNGGSPILSKSDEDLLSICLEQLSLVFNKSIPQPTDYVMTRWKDNPYTLGSYSYIPVGASFNDMKILSRNVGKKVYFAGEGTHSKHFSTTHGALLSGVRAAKEINKDAYLDY